MLNFLFDSLPVMEHLGGGEIKWRTNGHEPILSVDQSRRIFRDAILGLEYRKYLLYIIL